MNELGLIIIWPNHLHNIDNITKELTENFTILECYDIQWDEKQLYNNFYRFYGDRLATSSIKEKTTSGNTFRLIIYKDTSPSYVFRTTARGIEKVNANFFDLKNNFRKKYGTRFGIHGSNDEVETNRDLSLLLGININDYRKKDLGKWNGKVSHLKRNITGSDNWSSFQEFFYFINSVEPYVILRNEELIFDLPDGEDIDFLVYDHIKFAYYTNAKKLSNGTQRVNYEITIANKKIEVDFRYIGDDYFDKSWQQKCMENRKLNKDNIYVLDKENAYYSLIYHALIHKKKFPKKYLEYFNVSLDELMLKLYTYMHKYKYKMVEPKDITVNFNKKYGGDIKLSRERRLRKKKGLLGNIKKLFNKLNHLVHFRKGPA